MSYDYTRTSQQTFRRDLYNSNGTESHSTVSVFFPDNREGTSVPFYRKKIALGQNASSGYIREYGKIEVFVVPAAEGHDKVGSDLVTTISGSGYALPNLPNQYAVVTAADESQCLSRLHKKVGDAVTAVQSLPFVYEYAKTKSMVAHRAENLLYGVHSLKHDVTSLYFRYRNIRNGWKRFVRDSSSLFLEWKWGWSPTFSDIKAGYEELRDGSTSLTTDPVRVKYERNELKGAVTSEKFGNCYLTKTCQLNKTLRISYVLRFSPHVLGAPTRFGVNAGSIPGAIWEETPWSWFADYFLDIQTFLNQWQYLSLPIWYGSKAVKRCTYTSTDITPAVGATGYSAWAIGSTERVQLHFRRDPITSIPFYVPTLNLAGPFEGTREWNIAALAGTKFSKW